MHIWVLLAPFVYACIQRSISNKGGGSVACRIQAKARCHFRKSSNGMTKRTKQSVKNISMGEALATRSCNLHVGVLVTWRPVLFIKNQSIYLAEQPGIIYRKNERLNRTFLISTFLRKEWWKVTPNVSNASTYLTNLDGIAIMWLINWDGITVTLDVLA